MTSNSTSACAAFFEARGRQRIVGGNTPFLIDRESSVWFVASGKIEVFSVDLDDREFDGTRQHFCTVHPGEAIFGLDPRRRMPSVNLLAVGVVGTRVLELDLQTLRDMEPDAAALNALAALVDGWVNALSQGTVRTIVPRPRIDVGIDADGEVSVAAGKRIRAKRDVVWTRQQSGASLFVGMEETAELPGSGRFPLTLATWLQTMEPTTLGAIGTASALREGSVWPGLVFFHETVLACEFFNTRLAAADELNRLREKGERDRIAHEAGISDLASVIDTHLSGPPAPFSEDRLIGACQEIGAWMGVGIIAPPKHTGDEGEKDPLDEIVRASRIRKRQVVLRDGWWRRETTPLLAFLQDRHRPVAILPVSATRYELVDPGAGQRRRLVPELARQLEPTAYTFYRPLPDGPLTPWRILRFAAERSTRDLVLPLAVGVVGSLFAMLSPYLMGLLVDTVLPEADRSQLLQLAIILGVVGISTALFDTVRQFSITRLETKMSGQLQPAIWDRLLGLPASFFRRFTAGDLSQRASAVDLIRRAMSSATLSTGMTALFSVTLLFQLFYYSWKLALVALVMIAIAAAATFAAGLARMTVQRAVIDVEGRTTGTVLQLLTGIAKIRVAGAEGRALAEWARGFATQKRLALKSGRIDYRLKVFEAGYPVVSSIVLFYAMAKFSLDAIMAGTAPLTTGEFIAFNAAFGTFLAQNIQLGITLASTITVVVPLFDRARPILDAQPEVDVSKADPGELSGHIEMTHVSFRYAPDGPLILDDVSIEMNPGEFIAIVGPSGSGKSTVMRLLLGLESPATGSIFYDGRELSQLDVQKLRRRIGVVVQNGSIRAGSVFDNIVGVSKLTQDDAWEAARMAGLEEDLRQMPMGLHTMMQQGGTTLSGGQRQRLLIARAIVNRPKVIFFDEATSALDNRTQSIVTNSLQELQATRVAIAHRLSTIIGADRIYVMVNGRVVEQGTYQELVAREGMFADLVRRQQA